MQVSVTATGDLERTMQVELPEDQVAGEVESRLVNLVRNTRIQGFRPGKAPMRIVRQRYASRVRQEVVGELVQRSFFEAISQEKLRPAAQPQIEPLEADVGGGVRYTAKFEVMPEFEPVAPESLEVTRPECQIADADIDRMIEQLRSQRRKLEPVERAAAKGDAVTMDFTGTIDGEPFQGGQGNGLTVELGSGRLVQGFEDGLAGHRTGDEFDLVITFPADYQNESLRSKTATFEVKVTQVAEPVLPEMNQPFFDEYGVKEGGVEAFRKEVREHMEREAGAVIRNRLRDEIVEALVRAHQVALPAALVEREKHRLSEQMRANMKAYGIEVTQEHEQLADPSHFEERARKRVGVQLIVAEIIRRQELKADPARVRRMIEDTARSYEDPTAIVNWYYADRQRLAEVEALVLEDEVFDWITARAHINTAAIPFDELMNKRQTEAA